MADNTWDQTRRGMHEFIDGLEGLTSEQRAAKKAEYDAAHNSLRASADRHEQNRADFLKGRGP